MILKMSRFAEQDLAESIEWYREKREGLSVRFSPLQKFSFCKRSVLVVEAIWHTSRDPTFWKNRAKTIQYSSGDINSTIFCSPL